jgi:ribosome-binding protein aMBF1 (putative translation factor)
VKQRKYTTFEEYLEKSLKDPKFKKAWDESETEYQISRKLIEHRLRNKLSQSDLAKKVKTTQAVISRIEGMSDNPSIHLIKRLANAIDQTITLTINP